MQSDFRNLDKQNDHHEGGLDNEKGEAIFTDRLPNFPSMDSG